MLADVRRSGCHDGAAQLVERGGGGFHLSRLCGMPSKQAGAFRIGDTAGTLDNIAACKLHRPGSVGFVSKSGGMSNEMYNVLSRTTDGLYEGARQKRRHLLCHAAGNPCATCPCLVSRRDHFANQPTGYL